jgi:hypothetical protein
MIDALGIYVATKLAPRMERFLAQNTQTKGPIWEWELFQYSSFYKSFFSRLIQVVLGSVRYFLLLLPGGVSLIAYWLLHISEGFGLSTTDWVLILIDLVTLGSLGVATVVLKAPKLKLLAERRNQFTESR